MRFLSSFHLLARSPSLATILLLLAPTTHATCYWPNGDTRDDYVQCPSRKNCCLKGETCLSNGLCFTANFGILYRGACADETWPIAECPRACYTVFLEIDSGWANLFQCNTSTDLLTCSHEDTSAGVVCNGNGLGTYDGYTSANVTAAQVGITEDTTTTTNTASSNSSSTTSTIPDSTCLSTTSSKTNSELLALGIGLGVALGVPLLIATGLLVYCGGQNRKQKKQIQQIQQIQQMSTTYPVSSRVGPASRAELHTSIIYPELDGGITSRLELAGPSPNIPYKN
ncbi:hypothetical protein N7454_003881 [Penicillium verhagenii]|nr:hypothetical protein N7454_003881 [Penicillium verhagenii]